MWCNICQQDVPGIASLEEKGVICCARCGKAARTDSAARGSDQQRAGEKTADKQSDCGPGVSAWDDDDASLWEMQPTADLDLEWELGDDARAAERLYRNLSSHGNFDLSHGTGSHQVFAHAHSPTNHWHAGAHGPRGLSPLATAPRGVSSAQRGILVLSWTALCLGLMALMCGSALLAWAYFAGRGELWAIGIPITVVAQVGLIVGLILQLDGLWHSHRQNAEALSTLDYRLSDLRQPTSMLNTSHSTSSQAVSNPQKMLEDVKGQLDILTMKMASDHW